jgi:WD40 repeat protein
MPRTLVLSAVAVALTLPAPAPVRAQEASAPRLDRFGDPLPVGALARLGTVRFHRCRCAAYSPDGKVIATADGREVNLWDVATSKKIRQLLVDRELWAAGLIFSHSGKKLAAVSSGGDAVQVWDLDTGNQVLLRQTDTGGYGGDWGNAAAFSDDDKTLYAATSRSLYVWDVASGKKLHQFPFRHHDKPVYVRMVAFAEGGSVAATQGENTAYLWDPRTGKLLHELELLRGGDVLQFSRDGKTLAVPGWGQWMRVFSVETGKKIHSVPVGGRVVSAAFSPDGKTLAAACNATMYSSSTEGNQIIQLWNVANFDAPPIMHPAPGIHSVMFSPDGKTLAWGSHWQTLCFMDRATGKDLRPVASHRGAIKALAWFPDGKRIVSAAEDGTIRLWDATTGEALGVLDGHVGEVFGMALYPNGKWLASCGRDRTFRLWDLEQGKSLAVLKDEDNSVVAAAFSADGKQLASGGYRGVVFLRDPASGRILEEIEIKVGAIASLAFAPDGTNIAALGDHSGGLLLRDLVTKKATEIPVEHGGSSVAYSPDGKLLAVGCDETLLLLDTATRRVVKTLPGHANSRGCVAFSPDSRYLASVSDGCGAIGNRSIRIFELASGTEIHPFRRDLPIFAAAFSPDGSKLVIGGADATALVLDLKNLTGKKRSKQLTDKELAAHWVSLGAADAAQAYEARADLLHASKSAVPFLAGRLQPAPAVSARRVAALIKLLDSSVFRERNEATRELERLGELAREALRKALAGQSSPETRQRLQILLGKLDHFTPSQLRHVRAVEILETIGTPEALETIERLAQGNADGLLTTESRAVLARLQKKLAPLPRDPIATVVPAPVREPSPPPGPVLADRDGDPMPAGAIARLGSGRWRLAQEPRRILLSPDHKTLAVVNSWSGVELFDAQTGRCVERLRSGFFNWGLDFRMSVALSADWQKVAALELAERVGNVLTISDRAKTKILKIDYGRKRETYPLVPEEVEAAGSHSSGTIEYLSALLRMLSFSPDSRTILASSLGEDFYLWEAETGKPRTAPARDDERLLTEWFATTGRAGLLRCEEGVGAQFAMLLTGKINRLDQIPGFLGSSVDGRRLLIQTEKDQAPRFTVLNFSRERVAAANRRTTAVEREFVWKGGNEVSAALSPDGTTVAVAGKGVICFYDVLTGQERRHDHPTSVKEDFLIRIQSVKFSLDGSRLALVGDGGKVRILSVPDGRRLAEIDTKAHLVTGLAFSPDGQTLLTTSVGAPVHVWEVATGQLVRRLDAATYLFSPDNRLLAASADTLKLFDLYTGRFTRECKAEGLLFGDFAFSPNSKLLAASCSDTTIVVWPTSPTEVKAVKPFDEKSLAGVLEKGSAAEAYAAIDRLIAEPERALAFLKGQLRPVPRVDAKLVEGLIADLDSIQAKLREAAAKELAGLGPLAEPALRAALSSEKVPAGAKKRIDPLLRELDGKLTVLSAEDVFHLRAIQALERIGTKRARELLATLGQGAEASPRTRAAAEALARLGH